MIASKQEVEELVEELRGYKGRHTEFITVYVPAGYKQIYSQTPPEERKEKKTGAPG